ELRLEAIVARREPYASLVDARESHGVSPAQRQRQAEWIKRHEVDLRKYCLGNAYVITSALARLSINVVNILKPMPAPQTVVPTVEAGAAWVAERLEAAGHAEAAQRVREVYGLEQGRKAQ